MSFFDELDSLGVDTKEGLGRIMGDADLYKMMLGMFSDSLKQNPVLEEQFDKEDRDDLIRNVHTLKGTTGNLSLTPLFTAYQSILGLLRDNKPSEAKALWLEMLPTQKKIIDCIESNR